MPYKELCDEEELKKQKQMLLADDSHSDSDDPLDHIPIDEVNVIQSFLESFILDSDGGSKENQIDVKHAVKAFPGRIDEFNVYRCRGQINFNQTKAAIIANNFDDQDELFKYFDDRNKSRLNKLNKKTNLTKLTTAKLIKTAEYTLGVIQKIDQSGRLSTQHQTHLENAIK